MADEDTIKEHATRTRRFSHCKRVNNPLNIVRFWFMYYCCASAIAELLSWTGNNVSVQGYWLAMYVRYCVPIIVRNTVQPHASQSNQHRMSLTLLQISKANASWQKNDRLYCVPTNLFIRERLEWSLEVLVMNSSIERPWRNIYIQHVGCHVRYGVPLPCCGALTMQAIVSVFEKVLIDNWC